MSSPASARAPVVLGSQTPTLVCHPPDRHDYRIADATIKLASNAGLVLDEWQKMAVREIMVTTSDRRPSAFEAALVVSRQNGKNAVLEAVELGWMFLLDLSTLIHSAHRVDTSQEHYLRMRELIEGYPVLSRRLYPLMRGKSRSFVETNGKESIKLKRDADHPHEVRLLFKARAHGGSRGFTGDRLVLDEAYDLPPRMIGNAVPALRARPASQVIYTTSPPHVTSEHVHGLLRRAQNYEGGDRLFLAAWLNDADTRLDDEEAWVRVNPALGTRISIESVRQEYRMMRQNPALRAEFARECAGIPEDGDVIGTGIVPYDRWLALAVDPPMVSQVAYGVAVADDHSWAAFGSAGRLSSGEFYVDVVENHRGTGWLVSRAAEYWTEKRIPFRIDPAGAEGAFIKPLRDAKVRVVEVSAREYQQACGAVLTAVNDGTIHHLGQAALDVAVKSAGKRVVGKEGAWVWEHPETTDISPLKAATLALSGVGEAKSGRAAFV